MNPQNAALCDPVRTLPDDLAAHLAAGGDYDSALPLQIEVLGGARRTQSAESRKVQVSMRNLATTYYRMGNAAAAALLFKTVLDIRRRTLPGDHPELLESIDDVVQLNATCGALWQT